jgi:hypothetical protein
MLLKSTSTTIAMRMFITLFVVGACLGTITTAFMMPMPQQRCTTGIRSQNSYYCSLKPKTQLYYTNSPSHSSSNSDYERFRQVIAAAAAAKAMYYQSEMTVQELDQIRASFEQLVQRNHLYYSTGMMGSTSQNELEVYYPEGVIHNPNHQPMTPSDTDNNNNSNDAVDDAWVMDSVDDDTYRRLLTSAGRRLRELEIQLLESLHDNDDGIDQLVHLWTTERNAESAYALLQMQTENQVCSQGLVKEEADLAELCRTYPGWAEPWSRLATLLFYKGVSRWSDALSAAEEAIRIKPWHFEALNVCTLIQAQMDHPDNPSVIFGDDLTVEDLRRRCNRLSRLALPKLDPTSTGSNNNSKDALEARKVWVSRAVATAKHQLQCAEQYTAARKGRQQKPAKLSPVTSTNSDLLAAWQ